MGRICFDVHFWEVGRKNALNCFLLNNLPHWEIMEFKLPHNSSHIEQQLNLTSPQLNSKQLNARGETQGQHNTLQTIRTHVLSYICRGAQKLIQHSRNLRKSESSSLLNLPSSMFLLCFLTSRLWSSKPSVCRRLGHIYL